MFGRQCEVASPAVLESLNGAGDGTIPRVMGQSWRNYIIQVAGTLTAVAILSIVKWASEDSSIRKALTSELPVWLVLVLLILVVMLTTWALRRGKRQAAPRKVVFSDLSAREKDALKAIALFVHDNRHGGKRYLHSRDLCSYLGEEELRVQHYLDLLRDRRLVEFYPHSQLWGLTKAGRAMIVEKKLDEDGDEGA